MGPDSTHQVTRSCNGLKSRGPNFLWGLVLLLSLYLHTSEFLVFLPRLDINEEKGKSWIKKFCRRVSPLSRRLHCTRLFFAADDMLEVASCCIWRDLALAPSIRIFPSLNLQSRPSAQCAVRKVYFSAQPNNLRPILKFKKNTILLNIYSSQLVRVRVKYTFSSFSDFQAPLFPPKYVTVSTTNIQGGFCNWSA